MFSWMQITQIGGSTILLPAAAAIAAWLSAGQAWRLAWYWCLLFAGGLLLVAASKIAYVGWGIGIEAVDFTGFSGHAMRAAAIIPPFFYILLQQNTLAVRLSTALLGMSFAALIAMSRVLLHFHSISEALSGWILGTAVCLCFLWLAEQMPKPELNRALVVGSFATLLAASFAKPIPTEPLIESAAALLSGHTRQTTNDRQAK